MVEREIQSQKDGFRLFLSLSPLLGGEMGVIVGFRDVLMVCRFDEEGERDEQLRERGLNGEVEKVGGANPFTPTFLASHLDGCPML